MKDRGQSQEEFEDTKGVVRIRKSDRRHNGQKKRNKRTNNDLQNITQKTNGRVTGFPRGELRCSGIYSLHMQPYQKHK